MTVLMCKVISVLGVITLELHHKITAGTHCMGGGDL